LTQLVANTVATLVEPQMARRVVLTGDVQGLGVRPAIHRWATRLGLRGCVQNSSRGVQIEIEGSKESIHKFEKELLCSLPRQALVAHLEVETIQPAGRQAFTIVHEPTNAPLAARVPQDRVVCDACLREITAPHDRRRNYPLTSCTTCGPRYSVIQAMPYERRDTTMQAFPMCAECRGEYESPRDRRFHAETMSCPECGPQVQVRVENRDDNHFDANLLSDVRRCLAAGKIVALKGVGGYQLLVDATNPSAVQRLRDRKGRRAKPLAVMVASDEVAEQLAHLGAAEFAALNDPSGPIVLAQARERSRLAPAVCHQLNTVGIMRPTTPLHTLVTCAFARPLVCTSGNREGDPLEYQNESADTALANVADVWLHHNRDIAHAIDDSVVRIIGGRRVSLRLGRGLAPLPLELSAPAPLVALGGHLKSALAWSNGVQCVLGPHIGDLETIATRERYLAHLKDMLRLYRFRPRLLVHDLHPDYFSTQWAARQKVPRLAVQHHHAHVAAGMLEHGWLERRVLGVAWDGTGYGPDGTIWGGEFLVCQGADFERVGRLRPFALPGGDVAIRQPWRTAISVCSQLDAAGGLAHQLLWKVPKVQLQQVQRVVQRPKLSPVTSSAGRLIDAAAALILGIDHVEFEGQAAMRLEAAADQDARGWYHFPVVEDQLCELDWRPLFEGLVADIQRGIDAGTLAMKFHRSLAHGIVSICRRWNELPVVFSGGVFQNKLLTELIADMGGDTSQVFGFPGAVPPNDGGLAAGQLAIAAAKLRG
jgi:hydrogenase maturation protein HypF